MTPEQHTIFCKVAASGVACGLGHRYEWLYNYIRFLPNTMSYKDIPYEKFKIVSAFLAFERTTASCEEEFQELQKMTPEIFLDRINAFFESARKTIPQGH